MGATSQKTVTGTFRFHIWGPKHVGHQAHLQKINRRPRVFQLGTPLPSLGVDGPGLPGRISIERPIAP